jgi:excisionase family DNA binding protein
LSPSKTQPMNPKYLIQIDRDELEDILAKALARAMSERRSDDLGEWLTRRQVADYLGVSVGTVDTYCRAGKLQKHYLAGGNKMPRFRRADVVRFGDYHEKYSRD